MVKTGVRHFVQSVWDRRSICALLLLAPVVSTGQNNLGANGSAEAQLRIYRALSAAADDVAKQLEERDGAFESPPTLILYDPRILSDLLVLEGFNAGVKSITNGLSDFELDFESSKSPTIRRFGTDQTLKEKGDGKKVRFSVAIPVTVGVGEDSQNVYYYPLPTGSRPPELQKPGADSVMVLNVVKVNGTVIREVKPPGKSSNDGYYLDEVTGEIVFRTAPADNAVITWSGYGRPKGFLLRPDLLRELVDQLAPLRATYLSYYFAGTRRPGNLLDVSNLTLPSPATPPLAPVTPAAVPAPVASASPAASGVGSGGSGGGNPGGGGGGGGNQGSGGGGASQSGGSGGGQSQGSTLFFPTSATQIESLIIGLGALAPTLNAVMGRTSSANGIPGPTNAESFVMGKIARSLPGSFYYPSWVPIKFEDDSPFGDIFKAQSEAHKDLQNLQAYYDLTLIPDEPYSVESYLSWAPPPVVLKVETDVVALENAYRTSVVTPTSEALASLTTDVAEAIDVVGSEHTTQAPASPTGGVPAVKETDATNQQNSGTSQGTAGTAQDDTLSAIREFSKKWNLDWAAFEQIYPQKDQGVSLPAQYKQLTDYIKVAEAQNQATPGATSPSAKGVSGASDGANGIRAKQGGNTKQGSNTTTQAAVSANATQVGAPHGGDKNANDSQLDASAVQGVVQGMIRSLEGISTKDSDTNKTKVVLISDLELLNESLSEPDQPGSLDGLLTKDQKNTIQTDLKSFQDSISTYEKIHPTGPNWLPQIEEKPTPNTRYLSLELLFDADALLKTLYQVRSKDSYSITTAANPNMNQVLVQIRKIYNSLNGPPSGADAATLSNDLVAARNELQENVAIPESKKGGLVDALDTFADRLQPYTKSLDNLTTFVQQVDASVADLKIRVVFLGRGGNWV